MFEDKPLTEHFSLAELTKTSNSQFQSKNRELTETQIGKLTEVAKLLEHIRFILETPLMIHSGYRCPDLNTSVGSTGKSQHLLCEAVDFVPHQQDLGNAFRLIWRDIKDKKTNVGQLIHETAHRAYGVTSWLHISLGEPYRTREKSRQILRMTDGKFELLA
jgi:hypothetical protein